MKTTSLKIIYIIVFYFVFSGISESKILTKQYLPQYNLWLLESTNDNHYSQMNPNIKGYGTDSLFLWQYVITQGYSPHDIFFIDSLYGWYVDCGGGVLRTSDSGFNWDTSNLINGTCVNGVTFLDRNIGWIVGNSGIIKKTTNGGINWINQDWQQYATYFSVHFFNPDTGFVVGLKPYNGPPHGYIIKTTNSGNNWIEVYFSTDTILSNYQLHRQFWLNNDTAWICGYNLLLKTTDAGLTYSNYYTYVPPTQNGYNVFLDIYFLNEYTGWICGSNLDHKNIYKTTNKGINWFFQDNPVAYYYYPQINGIIFINSDTGFASSYVGLIIVTTNGGTNWIISQTINDETWRFSKYGQSKIWLTGGIDKIWYSNLENPNGIIINANKYPGRFALFQNYPNPFNPATKIKFDVPSTTLSRWVDAVGGRGVLTRLTIYDLLGREITTLINQPLQPGTYEVEWDGSNYASGIYFYKLISGDYSDVKKLVLLK
jgi:photosystem II stability/assembly factor-like uncharacterized protein